MKSIRHLLTATLTAGALLTAAAGTSFASAADAAAATQPPPRPEAPDGIIRESRGTCSASWI